MGYMQPDPLPEDPSSYEMVPPALPDDNVFRRSAYHFPAPIGSPQTRWERRLGMDAPDVDVLSPVQQSGQEYERGRSR